MTTICEAAAPERDMTPIWKALTWMSPARGRSAGCLAAAAFGLVLAALPLDGQGARAETVTVKTANRSLDCEKPTRRAHRRCVPAGRRIRQVVVRVDRVQGASRITGPKSEPGAIPPNVRLVLPERVSDVGRIDFNGRCVVLETTARPRGTDPITGACRGYGQIDLALEITY